MTSVRHARVPAGVRPAVLIAVLASALALPPGAALAKLAHHRCPRGTVRHKHRVRSDGHKRTVVFCVRKRKHAAPSKPAVTTGPSFPADAATYEVGAAKVDVTPVSLSGFYLGGYGIGPVHEATGVLRHIYFRVIAIRDRDGSQAVIGALDSQGYSVAYQQGPYGFADIESDIQHSLGIPSDHVILQATHSHNGPDEIGVWGGVPDAYFAFVKAQIESAVEQAVAGERPAVLRWATADMTGFSGTFGSNTDATQTGDEVDYPIDNQLRVLQGVGRDGQVIATLLNYSSHATVYGPLDEVAPDWPGSSATFLEHDQEYMPSGANYGYPGSIGVVMVGAVGHTWPASVPASDSDPGVAPPPKADPADHVRAGASNSNYPADRFGDAVAQKAIDALAARPIYLDRSTVAGVSRDVRVVNLNPVLLAAAGEPANPTPLGGLKVDRADTPPWGFGDVFVTNVHTLRIGDLAMFGVPGEPYPSIHSTLQRDVDTPAAFVFGLAQDQLGYVEELADYNGALQCSTTDEWFFTISPTFGGQVVDLERDNARDLGFAVSGSPLEGFGLGQLPPATNCTTQQIAQSQP